MTARYKPGDRIVYTGWGGGAGIIVHCSPKTAVVRLDERDKAERYGLTLLRPETAEDIARRERAAALQAWTDRRPKLQHLTTVSPSYSSLSDNAVAMHGHLRTPDDMRAAANELQELARWFADKPVES